MEQLANMPLWAQILSMGSFMFASWVLMTRIPLAPAIILSFFYLYGAFNTAHNMPSFTLHHPWIILLLHIIIPLIFLFLLMIAGYSPIGIGLLGLGILTLLGCGVWQGVALFKWVLGMAPTTFQWSIISICWWSGLLLGIWGWLDLCTMGSLPNYPLWKVFNFVILSLSCVAICMSVCFSFGKPAMWIATFICCILTSILALVCVPKPIDTYFSEVMSLWTQRKII